VPTGTVTFLDGNTVLGTAPVNAGQATLTVSLGVGNHALTASFAGTGNFANSTSAALAETVSRAATAVALASSANPAAPGQAVTFTATVSAIAPGAGTPTGTVTFKDGAVILGTVAVGAGGTATFPTSFAAAGGHAITAVYNGDPDFAGSSQSLTEQVNSAAPPTLAPIANQTVAAGQSLTLTLQGNDPAGLPLTYSARVDSLAYHLKATLGLHEATAGFFTNVYGGGEQWVQGTGGTWYYILPSGAFYQWSGASGQLTGTLVAQLGSAYNANPSLLVNAQPGQGQATVSVVGARLTITPNPGFSGPLFVTASVSDGQQSTSQAFQLTVG
jgi:hypothetical protein